MYIWYFPCFSYKCVWGGGGRGKMTNPPRANVDCLCTYSLPGNKSSLIFTIYKTFLFRKISTNRAAALLSSRTRHCRVSLRGAVRLVTLATRKDRCAPVLQLPCKWAAGLSAATFSGELSFPKGASARPRRPTEGQNSYHIDTLGEWQHHDGPSWLAGRRHQRCLSPRPNSGLFHWMTLGTQTSSVSSLSFWPTHSLNQNSDAVLKLAFFPDWTTKVLSHGERSPRRDSDFQI